MAAALVAIFALGPCLVATRSMILVVDSRRYALVSQQLCLGRGLRCPVFDLHDRPDSSGTVPFTLQAPLLPLVLASMGGVTSSRTWPARALNVASLVMTCVFSFLIASRLCGITAGVVAGITVAVSSPLLLAARYILTETLFIFLFVASVGLLQASRHAKPRWCFLIGSGLAAAAATATRYTGIALLPLFFWEASVIWRRGGSKRALITICLTIPLMLAYLAALWTRNVFISGHVWGSTTPADQPREAGWSLFEAVRGMMAMTAAQFGVWGINFKSVIKGALAVILIGTPASIAMSRLKHRTTSRLELLERGLDIVLVAAVSYFGLLVCHLWSHQAVFEYRFATPLVPLLFIAMVATVTQGWRSLDSTRLRRWACWALVATLTLIVLYVARQSFKWSAGLNENISEIPTTETYEWLVNNAEKERVIVTNQPFILSFSTGQSALRLPNRVFDPWAHIPQDMYELLPNEMSRVGANYLVIFSAREGLRADHWGDFIAALSRREPISNRLTIVWDCPDGVIYKMKE